MAYLKLHKCTCGSEFLARCSVAKDCATCRKARRKQTTNAWHHANREKHNDQRRAGKHRYDTVNRSVRLEKAYRNRLGISRDVALQLRKQQGGLCAICSIETAMDAGRGGSRGWALDHDHSTGRVRDILCNSCNRILGAIENASNVQNYLEYLERHRRNPRDLIVSPPPRTGKGGANRSKSYCKHGHPFSGDNLIVINRKDGYARRVCRTCRDAALRR